MRTMLLMLFTLIAMVKPITINDGIEQVNKKLKKIDTYRCDYKIMFSRKTRNATYSGTCEYMKPDRYKLHLKNKLSDLLIIKDREKKISYSKQTNIAIVDVPFKNSMDDFLRYLEFHKLFGQKEAEDISESLIEEKPVYVFMYKNHNTLRCYIEKSTGLLLKADITTSEEKKIVEIVCSNHTINVPLSKKDFEFKIPEDAQVVDLRKAKAEDK